MSYKTTQRPVQQAKQRPLTDEEKKERVIQFFMQKREQYAISILSGMVQGEAFLSDNDCVKVVKAAIFMAGKLLDELYPINDEVHKAAEE